MRSAVSAPEGKQGSAPRSLHVAYLGNFGPWWSTECHVALSLEALGHRVSRLQEGEVRFTDLADMVQSLGADLFLWTQTWGLSETGGSHEERLEAVEALRSAGIPTMSFHLDKWWDVQDGRADRIGRDAFFRTDVLATADGPPERWRSVGVNAVYSPPGVYHAEAIRGTAQRHYRTPVAFVGSWRGSYHPEWRHRAELVHHLQTRWRRECAFWPRGPQIRGRELADLYASVTVVVGDSYMPPGSWHYSDRIPETIGRGGGILLHPRSPAVEADYVDGEHLRLWNLGDWDALDALIDHYIRHPDEARAVADRGQAWVQERHTYRHRMETLLPLALSVGAPA